MLRSLYIIFFVAFLASCSSEVGYRQVPSLPPMFPDYSRATIPYNIAPLNFRIDSADRISVTVKGRSEWTFERRGELMRFPEKRWREMLAAERGDTVEVYVRARFGKDDRGWRSLQWVIADEPIDRYMSYRLIEPAYEVWNMLQIVERDLTGFDERILGDNNVVDRACINCHTSNRAEKPATFMHVRGKGGGTVYSFDGELRKVNTATDRTSAAVYGEIERSGRYGIFTTAEIIPMLHSMGNERMEVYDTESDLILVDFAGCTVSDSPCVSGPEYQETFPCFSPDGETIYFCRAKALPQPDSTFRMHYDLCAIDFDAEAGRLGDSVRVVFDATAAGKSVSFPKCSPDGRFLLMTVSDYGTFPIWHRETDLWMLDLRSGRIDSLPQVNGRYSDSYHSWGSNSRWVAFASKRDDRVYGRPYIAYVSPEGEVGEPFVLPQRDPRRYLTTLKSFNIPELYASPEVYDTHSLSDIYFDAPAEKFEYKENFSE